MAAITFWHARDIVSMQWDGEVTGIDFSTPILRMQSNLGLAQY